ncbi:endonuclease domain-containing protein [Microbispora sp. NBRC 16548]|uniref:endonuclease domain-containing protein n=1 Tax=Microbispora sp. NBRC 16548 TaxID=3030994 RepID=UPI0024A33AFE|nr:endonuclease domain-containing protein [Microbispora sp. NBRC 16548]GLX06766.1 hypothetical protein Misp03_36930 [Microbispora sp. NBRC 16548]
MGDEPEVRIVDGRIVMAPGVGPVAMVWLPQHGQVIAKIPAKRGNKRWLRATVGVRSPRLDKDRWYLPRNCLTRLVTAAVDRYGYIAVWRDMSKLSHCNKACLEATGVDCDCACLGTFHGEGSDGWYERVADAMVADRGGIKRTVVVYGGKMVEGAAVIYDGELAGKKYLADRADRARLGWPKASQFMCAGCLTARARVWDHCHTHKFVRASLCTRCNTRHWSGWQPEHGRAASSRNLDTTYYRWCPHHAVDPDDLCSA